MAGASNTPTTSVTPAESGGRVGALRLIQAALVTRVLRAARGVVLARFLAPDVFGGFAMIGAVIGPLSSLTNVGLTGLLAREASPSTKLVATARWVNRTIVVLSGMILVAAVVAWAAVTGHRSLLGPGAAVALATALYLSPQVALGLLQQRREFRSLARLDVAFDVVWTAVAVALAVGTGSIWALVLAELLAQILRAVLARALAGSIPPPRRHGEEFHGLLRFSSASVLGGVLWSLVFALPVILLQRHVAAAAIGLFSLAYTYAQLVALLLGGVAARVVLPTLAAATPERRLEVAWRYAEKLSLLLAPFTGLLAVVGPPLLVALAGDRWTGAAVPMAILAWGMAARVFFPMNALAVAANRPGLDNWLASLSLASLVGMELVSGFSTPVFAAQIVAATDVGVILGAVLMAHTLWGPAPRAYVMALVVWGAAIASWAVARTIPESANLWVDVAKRGVTFGMIYLMAVILPRWTRMRYAREIKHTWELARERLLTL